METPKINWRTFWPRLFQEPKLIGEFNNELGKVFVWTSPVNPKSEILYVQDGLIIEKERINVEQAKREKPWLKHLTISLQA